jgi:SAM-dependent methyltransferase
MNNTRWYIDWQNPQHAIELDLRCRLNNKNLVRNYECFNDVRLLNERVDPSRNLTILEVGCATGEFYRYLGIKYRNVNYYGIDVSQPAVERAKQKYPQGNFFCCEPSVRIQDTARELGIPANPEILYAKDVIHHQTRPLDLLDDILEMASEAVIVRCRTRDVGPTETDPEKSCQYHYRGWMPYIVMNLQEVIGHITSMLPGCEVVVYRHHTILGGRENRFIPKDCHLPETGTAETVVGIFKRTEFPGKVVIQDRQDQNPHYTLGYKIKLKMELEMNRTLRILSRIWS